MEPYGEQRLVPRDGSGCVGGQKAKKKSVRITDVSVDWGEQEGSIL